MTLKQQLHDENEEEEKRFFWTFYVFQSCLEVILVSDFYNKKDFLLLLRK